MTNYIDTEHTQADETITRKVVAALQRNGYDVAYGSGPPWEFDSDEDREEFETTLADRLWEISSEILTTGLTPAEIETGFALSPGTVRQYLKRHGDEMMTRGVARKADGRTWLIHRREAERIWGK